MSDQHNRAEDPPQQGPERPRTEQGPERPPIASGAGQSSLNLGLGHPSLDLLPAQLLRDAANSTLARARPPDLQYGPERGSAEFRKLLARFLDDQDGHETNGGNAPVDPERLFVTAGASQALDLLCTLYARSGDVVLTTEPTYHLAQRIFADHGLEAIGVPSDQHGPRIDALGAELAQRRPALIYLVPYFANPSGFVLSSERRKRLLELAGEHRVPVVSDEVYRLLGFTGEAPRTLARRPPVVGQHGSNAPGTGENEGLVIAINSFSKILAPGLRLGWIEAPEPVLRRIEECGLLGSGGGLNPMTTSLVAEVLRRGALAGHLEHLRRSYSERARALASGLRKHLPDLRFEDPGGGYFVWAHLPGWDGEAALAAASALGVTYQPGPRFSTAGGLSEYCRLSFSHYLPQELEEGARRLAQAVESDSRERSTATPDVSR